MTSIYALMIVAVYWPMTPDGLALSADFDEVKFWETTRSHEGTTYFESREKCEKQVPSAAIDYWPSAGFQLKKDRHGNLVASQAAVGFPNVRITQLKCVELYGIRQQQ